VAESMRKAARIVGYDILKADAQAVAAKADSKRKDRPGETAPNGSTATEGRVLTEYEISEGVLRMQVAGEPADRIRRWTQQQHERRRNATK